jgi:hypothetical protein
VFVAQDGSLRKSIHAVAQDGIFAQIDTLANRARGEGNDGQRVGIHGIAALTSKTVHSRDARKPRTGGGLWTAF